MKRVSFLVLSTVVIFIFASCGGQNAAGHSTRGSTASVTDSSITSSSTETIASTSPSSVSGTSGTTESSNTGSTKKEELLQSVNADLDGDGEEETIRACRILIPSSEAGGQKEQEGLLRITNSKGTKEVSFIKKATGMTGVMSSMEIRDLDGDGSRDVIVVVPDSGAAFELNYFFIYSFKKDKSYSYNSNNELADFAGSFVFKYKGKGILDISNSSYGFTAEMNITDKSRGITADDENNSLYDNSWVEPVPVKISEDAKIAIIKSADGKPEIKVPLPIFGQATANMIGEVDLYYRVDDNFQPYINRFEVLDFNGSDTIKIGSIKVK